MGDALLAHVLDRVAETPLCEEPFPHLVFAGILPRDFYDELLASLPEPSLYTPLLHKDALRADGSSTRSTFTLDDASLARTEPEGRAILRRCRDAFASPEFQRAVFARYERTLRQRFGRDPAALDVEGTVKLQRDEPGYRIGVHPDTADKVVLVQLYLPADDSGQSMGTSFYTRGSGDFLKVKTLEFRCNSGYSFVKTDESWHGVDPIGALRHSLTLNYRLRTQRLRRAFKKNVMRRVSSLWRRVQH